MRFQNSVAVLTLGLVALLPVAAQGGWAIIDENGHRTSVSRGRLKMAPQGAQGVSMALDIGRARLWVADAGRKTYWEGTVEQYCQAMKETMAGAMADMQAQMAAAMKDMPPEQRAQMQQMMNAMRGGGAGPAPTVTAEKTGEVETIAGLSAKRRRTATVRVGTVAVIAPISPSDGSRGRRS